MPPVLDIPLRKLAGCGFIVGEHALVEGQGDESFESLSEPGSAFAISRGVQAVGDLADGDSSKVKLLGRLTVQTGLAVVYQKQFHQRYLARGAGVHSNMKIGWSASGCLHTKDCLHN